MTEQELERITAILDGPIPGPKATQKEIHQQSVLYHKCAGSLLDEVKRLRNCNPPVVITHHEGRVLFSYPCEGCCSQIECFSKCEECKYRDELKRLPIEEIIQ